MLKFFRKIRGDLLSKGKSWKYLSYAIGEIVLVVIGILIALQINNWNEARKNKLREHSILIQLEEDYGSNLQQLDEKIALRNRIINSGLILLGYMDAPENVVIDSLIYHISNIVFDPTFDPIQNDLINSGNNRIISNERLRRLLSNWTSDVVAVQEQERINQTHVHEFMFPVFNELGITRHVLGELWHSMGTPLFLLDKDAENPDLPLRQAFSKIEKSRILSHVELEGIVSSAISYNTICNLQSESLRNRIVEILTLLRKELKLQES